MKDYATIPNINGTFPNVTSKNASGGAATDGTPYVAQVLDDLWGFSQALMNDAGLTPDNVTESATASQRMTAIRNVAGHPGEVIAWMGNAADPSASGIRLLPLNGQGVLRTSYPLLDTATYVGDPDNPTAEAFYHADDAAGTIRNTTGIYLILPDLRGYFLRGLDTAAAIDPDGAGREIGDSQSEDVMEHGHEQCALAPAATYDDAVFADITYTSGGVTKTVLQDAPSASFAFDMIAVTTAAGDQTVPYNSACRWCIRY
jgi:hypothetical protein